MSQRTAPMGGGLPAEALRAQMERLVASRVLGGSKRLQRFLRYVVEEHLAGRDRHIKGVTIARAAYDRDESFDPLTDPLVRVEAARLRRRLAEYYEGEGREDPILVEIPKGGYVPQFRERASAVDSTRSEGAPLPGPSIAVLPFLSLGEATETDYFADGLTEELTTELTRFEGFQVISRHSVLGYRDGLADTRHVGRDLGVRFVLEGSVRRRTPRMRISARLVDANDGMQVWAESFDGDLSTGDLFAVQNEITRQVVARVASEFGVIPRRLTRESRGKRTDDLTAHEAVLQYHHYNSILSRDTHARARAALEHAVARDPDYAAAWAALSEVYWDSRTLGLAEIDDAERKAEDAARRAVSLDSSSQHARWALALTYFHRRRREELLREASRILELNPNAAHTIGTTGWLVALAGEWEEGLAMMERMRPLNPHFPGWFHVAPFQNHYRQEQYAAAYTEAEQIRMPELLWDSATRAAALGALGRHEEAHEAVAELLALDPGFAGAAREYLGWYVFEPALLERLLDGLRRAGLAVPEVAR